MDGEPPFATKDDMGSPDRNPNTPNSVRFNAYVESGRAADLLDWLGDEVERGELVVRENGDQWTFQIRGAVRGDFEVSCRGHSGRLRLKLTWEEPANGPIAIIAD